MLNRVTVTCVRLKGGMPRCVASRIATSAMLVAGMAILAGCGAASRGESAVEVGQDQAAVGDQSVSEQYAAPSAAESSAGGAASAGLAMSDAPAAAQATVGAAPAREAVAAGTPGLPEPAAPPGDSGRKIVKDATMSVLVENIDLGQSRIGGIAAQAGGYVLESRTDNSAEGFKQAFVKIAVPVDQFEASLQRVREAAKQVYSEQASGVDVSQEFVDLQSEIANLEATQARVRQFLDQATTVEEALGVNAKLTEIEGEISQRKGRLQSLGQRAAFSTIAVQLQAPPPEATITPTPSATPTPTPAPAWDPAKPAGQAFGALKVLLQALATLTIWLVIFVLPFLLPLLVIWLVVRHYRKQP